MKSTAPIWPVMLRICAVMLLCSLVAYQVWLIADRLLAPAVGRQLYCSLDRLLFGSYACHGWGWPAWSWLQIPATLTYLTAIVLLGAAGWTAMRARLNSHVPSLGWEPSTSPTQRRVAWRRCRPMMSMVEPKISHTMDRAMCCPATPAVVRHPRNSHASELATHSSRPVAATTSGVPTVRSGSSAFAGSG